MTSTEKPVPDLAPYNRARDGGLLACLGGALIMVSGRFVAGVPHWLAYVGVGTIVLGWGLFAFALVYRARHLRQRARNLNS